LIFVPKGFKNSGAFVNENFPLKTSPSQSQIYLNETTLDNIEDFFQIVSIQNKDLKDLPLTETFYLIAHDETGQQDKGKNRDIYVLNLNVISNQEVLDLNDVEEEEEIEEEEEEE